MVEFADWESWLIPLVLLLLVYSAFSVQLNELVVTVTGQLSTMFSSSGEDINFAPVAFGLIVFFILLVGITLAIYLHGDEVNMRNVGARVSVLLILFAMAWMVNKVQTIVPLT